MSSTSLERSRPPCFIEDPSPQQPSACLRSAIVAPFELLSLRAREREDLRGLNDRFAGFIDRVHQLEQQNKLLEAELMVLRKHETEPSRLRDIFERELRELRAQADEEQADKARLEAGREQLRSMQEQLEAKLEEETRQRENTEATLQKAREEAEHTALLNAELDRKICLLLDEIAFLKRLHDAEISELVPQIRSATVTVEADQTTRPDLSVALQDIRSQYEKLAAKNMQAAEDWYRTKVQVVTETAAKSTETARSIREEGSEYRRLIQSRGSEIEAMKNINDSLLRQIKDQEDNNYIEKIREVEENINDAKKEMTRYLKEYQDLYSQNMEWLSLDVYGVSATDVGKCKTLRKQDAQNSLTYRQKNKQINGTKCL
uniref:Neurofilament, light polypeptide b n=1 Tax=Eptatretus burgeri TaxID=7764 RepID=A0A8C4N263_EPTBU